jgi:hypothetical protein
MCISLFTRKEEYCFWKEIEYHQSLIGSIRWLAHIILEDFVLMLVLV